MNEPGATTAFTHGGIVGFHGRCQFGGPKFGDCGGVCFGVGCGWVRAGTVAPIHQMVWRWANGGVSLLCLGVVLYPPLTDDALTALFCWMMAYRAWTNHGPQTDAVHLVIGLLVLSYGATVSPGALTLALCVLWVLLAAPLLWLRHLHGLTSDVESDQVEGWACSVGTTAPIMGVLAAIPHVGLTHDPAYDHSREVSANGLIQSGALTLSDLAEVTLDPGIVARIRTQNGNGESLSGPLSASSFE